MSISPSQKFEQASIYSDLGSLNAIRQQGQTDQHGAMKKAAKEFEAFFMNMMLKSMRQASEVMGDNPLTDSDEEKMFTGMMDEQLSINLSQQGHLGIAELMISQLSREKKPQDNQNQLFTKKTQESDIKAEGSIPVKVQQNSLNEYRKHPVVPALNIQKSSLKTIDATLKPPKGTESQNKSLDAIKPALNSDKNLNETFIQTNIALAKDNLNLDKASNNATVKINSVEPEKKSLFDEIADFVTTLLPLAEEAAQKLNLDPKLLLAQAALETGWGKFIMHDESGKPGFNLFGIKADKGWQGDSIKINTLEVENQAFKKVKASFRKYENFADSFNDYVDFIQQNPRYQKALETTGNAKEYIKQLQTSGYATDPNYAKKIIKIFSQNIFGETDAGGK